MRYFVALLVLTALSGCDFGDISNSGEKLIDFGELPSGGGAGEYALFETSKGVVYRLNTSTGNAEVFDSPTRPRLVIHTLYKGEDDKTYEYLGDGHLKELSESEVFERTFKRYDAKRP